MLTSRRRFGGTLRDVKPPMLYPTLCEVANRPSPRNGIQNRFFFVVMAIAEKTAGEIPEEVEDDSSPDSKLQDHCLC